MDRGELSLSHFVLQAWRFRAARQKPGRKAWVRGYTVGGLMLTVRVGINVLYVEKDPYTISRLHKVNFLFLVLQVT